MLFTSLHFRVVPDRDSLKKLEPLSNLKNFEQLFTLSSLSKSTHQLVQRLPSAAANTVLLSFPPGPSYAPGHRPTVGSQERMVSYERGIPVVGLKLDGFQLLCHMIHLVSSAWAIISFTVASTCAGGNV